jgi:signal transduction histidine kinase/ligand-binding sensor domain-containing protein
VSTRICRIAGIFLTALLFFPADAIFASEAKPDWLARSWQTDDGLPDNSVAGVAQAGDGYLWIGTPTGLAHFDGLHFENFSLTNIVAPPNRGIITMLRGRHGALWLGMDRGAVVCLAGAASRAYIKGLPKLIPGELAEDGDGTIWVAYRGGEVFRIQNNIPVQVTARDGLPDGTDLCALATDNNGRLWFAKSGQVGVMREGRLQTLLQLDGQPMRLANARDGGVWVCCGSKLSRCTYDGRVQQYGEFHPENSGTTATALLEDDEGAVWIATSFSGLYRYDPSGFEAIPTSHERILSLTEDNEGNIWVGTFGGGLDRIRRRIITLEGTEAGLPFSSVQSLCEAPDGVIWAAAQNGVLAQRVDGRWNSLPVTDQWPGEATCVTAERNGTVWIGTHQNGLFCWRAGRFVDWGNNAPLRGNTIHNLVVTTNGDLWFSQENPGAVVRLRDGVLKHFPIPTDSRIVRAMADDPAGNIYFGTSKGNLYRIAHDQMVEVTPRPAQDLASIRCLYVTPDGALWIGYAGWGVGCLKEGHYFEVGSEQGLYDDYISHVLDDGHGWLWFGSNRGIFKVRQQDLEDIATGKLSRVRSVHYGRGDGLPSLQATFGDSPDVLRSRDGRIWIPMQTALAVSDPAKLYENPEAPPVLLTRVSVDDRLVARYGGILPANENTGEKIPDLVSAHVKLRVPPSHHRIEFEFAALGFNAPENVQFRYRLTGLDDDWVEAGSQQTAKYLHLPAGNYVFEVTACNSDGDWNKTGARVDLVVLPFFWQQWWFRIAVLAAFTLSIAAVVRYVSFRRLHHQLYLLEQQAALQRERARIAKDIHDDLGANLTQIAFLGELAQQDSGEPGQAAERVTERVAKISTTARQAIKSLDEIVWAVNPRNDTLAHLLDYAGQFAVDYLRLAGVRCRLDFPEQIPACELSTDLRHNLFLAIKEALHNIVKHAHASEVWLRAGFTGQSLNLVVEDNGCGFAGAPDDALADGLRNMRQRMEDIGGEFKFESQANAGTRIHFHLSLHRNGPGPA